MKRFTETNKWNDPWFWELSPTAKLLWYYLTEHCDCAGLFDLSLKLASVHIGAEVTEAHLTELGDRVQRSPCGKVFIPQYIPFQYGELSVKSPAHKRVLQLVKERNLSRNGKGYQYPSDTLAKGIAIPKPTHPLPQGKGSTTLKEEEEEEEEDKGIPKPTLAKPTIDQAQSYGHNLGMTVDEVQAWFDHYQSNGWKVSGKTPMKDWEAALRNGARRARENRTSESKLSQI